MRRGGKGEKGGRKGRGGILGVRDYVNWPDSHTRTAVKTHFRGELVDFRKRRTMVHKDSYVEKRDSLENILTQPLSNPRNAISEGPTLLLLFHKDYSMRGFLMRLFFLL